MKCECQLFAISEFLSNPFQDRFYIFPVFLYCRSQTIKIFPKPAGLRVGPQQLIDISQIRSKYSPILGLKPHISHAERILFLFRAIFDEKSVMYLQTTTIYHINFYMPNMVLRPTRRLFYARH